MTLNQDGIWDMMRDIKWAIPPKLYLKREIGEEQRDLRVSYFQTNPSEKSGMVF
jgi:hypothetical protein